MDVNRRRFLGAAAFAVVTPAKDEEVYRFRTADAEIEMTIEFHDALQPRLLVWRANVEPQLLPVRRRGGGAQLRRRFHRTAEPVMREYVRTIDHGARLPDRPPFDRSIVLNKGVGSDPQAFGYEAALVDEPISGQHGPWYLYRQDLFLEPQRAPFLVVYWKHAWASIRVLDIIPGDQTWLEKK